MGHNQKLTTGKGSRKRCLSTSSRAIRVKRQSNDSSSNTNDNETNNNNKGNDENDFGKDKNEKATSTSTSTMKSSNSNNNNNPPRKSPSFVPPPPTPTPTPSICENKVANKPPFIEVLPPPEKPLNDRKQYRIIRLENGARIALISELTNDGKEPTDVELPYVSDSKGIFIGQNESVPVKKGGTSGGSLQSNERLQDSCFNCESFRLLDQEVETCEVKSSRSDTDFSYNSHTPDGNQMISIAVVVGSGFLNEPKEFGGLAHFCEHMVFLGSQDFPKEDHFMTLIRETGGVLNACTMAESTMYYYEVKQRFVNETLEVFSSFFVDPLFRIDAMQREVNAVDHEFRMKRQHDMLTRMEILKDMAKKDHPMRNFSWGDKESLAGDESPEHYEKLRQRLVKYHDENYIAPNITIAIQGSKTLDDLQQLAVRYFSKLRNGKICREIPKKYKNPFDTPSFNKKYTVKPVGALEYLYLTWTLPKCVWTNYLTKPLSYLSSVISSEVSGGLVDCLKKKNWIMDLCSGLQFQSRTNYGVLFTIKMFITSEGYKNQDSIIETVFSYLETLKKRGPNQAVYEDLQEVRNANLSNYENSRQPLKNVKKMACSLQMYPSSDIIMGETKFYCYDPKAIINALQLLEVDNMNVMVFSHGYEQEKFPLVESRTGCRYDCQSFSKQAICAWGKAKVRKDFAIPSGRNPYKTIDFSCLNHRGLTPRIVPVVTSEKLSVMYVPVELQFPFAAYNVVVQSKGGRSTGVRQAFLHLFTSMLRFELREDMGFAKEAGIFSSIEPGNGNLNISVYGYDKMALKLVRNIMDKITHKIFKSQDQNFFKASKDFHLKLLHLMLLQPSTLAFNLLHRLKYWGDESLLAMHTALIDIEFNEFQCFVADFMKELKIYMFAVGNVLEAEVQEVADTFNKIKYNSLKDFSPFHIERSRMVMLPNIQLNWRVESFNKNGTTSMVLNYYQMTSIKNGGMANYILSAFVMRMMCQPFFTQLRTQKSLGYQVGCCLTGDGGILGACFLVCSDADKFTVDVVNQEVDNFIQRFYDEQIKNMTEAEFQKAIRKFNMYPLNKFNHTHPRQFFETFLLAGGSHYRKASIQITGHSKRGTECQNGDLAPSNLTPSPSGSGDFSSSESSYKKAMNLKTYKLPGNEVRPNVHYIQNVDVLHMYLNLYGRQI